MATNDAYWFDIVARLVEKYPGLTARELVEFAPNLTPIDWFPVILRRAVVRGLVDRRQAQEGRNKAKYTYWPIPAQRPRTGGESPHRKSA